MRGQDKVRMITVVCWGVLIAFLYQEWGFGDAGAFASLPVLCRAFLLLASVLCAAVTLRVSLLPACRYTPVGILILQYLFDCLITALGAYFSRTCEKQTIACQRVQEEFLHDLLRKHAQTKYGRDHHFESVKSSAAFRQQHPLTVHSDYELYLKQVAAGEEDILIRGKPLRLGLTSGTTGGRKLIPTSKLRTLLFVLKFVPIGQRILRQNFLPSFSPLLKTCYVYTHCTPGVSAGGITIGPTTMLNLPDVLYRLQYSTPPAGMRLTNEKQAVYVHLLFALRDSDLQAMFAIFASTLYYTFRTLEAEWPHLVDDLRNGRIGDDIGLDRHVKTTLEEELQADHRRADELEAIFRAGFDNTIACRIWPRLSSLWGVTSGSMTVYEDMLHAKYAKDLPIVSMIYNSTEGLLGVLHGKAKRTEYVTFPGDIFYEFIPFEACSQSQPDTLLAEEVTVGSSYEVVITSMDGLYRYRMGDVVMVTGFYNKAPILEFQHRVGDVLDLCGEMTTEISIKAALKATLVKYETLNLVDFTCLESSLLEQCVGNTDQKATQPAYYTVFAEIDGLSSDSGKNTLQQIIAEVDSALCQLSVTYNDRRTQGMIGLLKVFYVRQDSFRDLRLHLADCTMQVKVPKVLRKEDHVRFLLQRVQSTGTKSSRVPVAGTKS